MIALTPEQRLTVESKFRDLANQWAELTAYRSNMSALRRHPLFGEIVALGEPAVPLILRELERKPSVSWFGLLATMTGEPPVPSELAGRVAKWPGRGSHGAVGTDISCQSRAGADLPGPGQ